jgi:RNA polymerase sigma-70 factor, ECF subfamily
MTLPGDRATFDQLVSASLPAALRFAVRLTGRLDTAEDVVQEAMLAASRSWKSFRGQSQFQTWLLRIVVNVHRNQVARRGPPETLKHDLVDRNQTSPSESAAATELAQRVATCIAALPLKQREVIVLSSHEGLSAPQIAEVLEMTVENVYSTLNIARTKLRQQLERYLVEKQ